MQNINEIKTTLLNLPYAMREDLSVVRKRLSSLESGESLEYSWEQVRDRLSNLH
jgi:hypothetical protein